MFDFFSYVIYTKMMYQIKSMMEETMLIRDKIPDNKEFAESIAVKESQNNSELMSSRKVFLKERIDVIISESISKNEKEVLSATADAIEALLSNVRLLGVPESSLVKIIEQKKSAFGSYDKGLIQDKTKKEG